MAPQLFGLAAIGVGALAAREVAPLAEETLAARNGERDDDAVAGFQLLVLRPDLDYFAHGFVTDDVAALHAGDESLRVVVQLLKLEIFVTRLRPSALEKCRLPAGLGR